MGDELAARPSGKVARGIGQDACIQGDWGRVMGKRGWSVCSRRMRETMRRSFLG